MRRSIVEGIAKVTRSFCDGAPRTVLPSNLRCSKPSMSRGKNRNKRNKYLFYNLRSISEHYTVALGLLGGCLSFLNRSYKDCKDTIQLTRTFLVEIAIFESVFADAYTRVLASAEFREWNERNPRVEAPVAEYDRAFRLNTKWAKQEAADEFVTEAKSRVSRDDLSTDHVNLKPWRGGTTLPAQS